MERIKQVFVVTVFLSVALLTAALCDDVDMAGEELDYCKSQLRALKKNAEQTCVKGIPLPQYFQLLQRLGKLEESLENLELFLGKIYKAPDEITLADFSIKASLDTADGKPAGEHLTRDDTLVCRAEVTAPQGTEGTLVSTDLFWQLYDVNRKPVSGRSDHVRGLKPGTTQEYVFRLPIKGLTPGKYYVGLTHYSPDIEVIRKQAVYAFTVMGDLIIDRLIVCASTEKQIHTPVLTPDQLPHIYVFYTLGKGVEKATATISVFDKKTSEKIITVTRDRPAEKPYFGIRLEDGAVRAGQKVYVIARVTPDSGKQQQQEMTFAVSAYSLAMSFPERITPGQSFPYRISVPAGFKAPISLELDASAGILITRGSRGGLSGTVSAVGRFDADQSVRISAMVRDSDPNGKKTAMGVVTVRVTPGAVREHEPDSSPAEPVHLPPAAPKDKQTPNWIKTYYRNGNLKEQYQVKVLADGSKIKHGNYQEYDEETRNLSLKGTYVNGKKHGKFISYGDITNWKPWFVSTYVNGKRQGVSTEYNIYKGKYFKVGEAVYSGGKKHGPETSWDYKGRVTSLWRWKNGMPDGLWQRFEPGLNMLLVEKVHWKANRKEGACYKLDYRFSPENKSRLETEIKKEQGKYSNNYKIGLWRYASYKSVKDLAADNPSRGLVKEEFYSSPGRIKWSRRLYDGIPSQKREYNAAGEVIRKTSYNTNGKLSEVTERDNKGNVTKEFMYDENGQLEKVSDYTTPGKVRVTYYEKGIFKETRTYDNKNNPLGGSGKSSSEKDSRTTSGSGGNAAEKKAHSAGNTADSGLKQRLKRVQVHFGPGIKTFFSKAKNELENNSKKMKELDSKVQSVFSRQRGRGKKVVKGAAYEKIKEYNRQKESIKKESRELLKFCNSINALIVNNQLPIAAMRIRDSKYAKKFGYKFPGAPQGMGR